MQPPSGAKRVCQVCLEMQYFKTAVLRPKAEQNGLVVYASAECYQKKKADKPCAC